MNLLFFVHNYPFPPEKDGQTLIAYHLLVQLAQRHRITLYCFGDRTDMVNEKIFTDLGISVRMFQRPKRLLWLYYLSPWRRRMAWFQYRLYDAAVVEEIKKADSAGDYDLIYLHAPGVSSYLQHIKETPVVYGGIDSMSAWFKQYYQLERNILKRFHYHEEYRRALEMEKELLPRAQAVTVVSPVDRDVIISHSPKSQITVVPNGVDTRLYRPGATPPDQNIIIFSGTMNYPPNVKAILDFYHNIWPRLVAQRPNLQWVIVGKNPTLEIFDLQSLDKRIMVTGYVKDIRPFLWRSTVYVSPLTIGTGFKNKVVEAMACGKAMVASPTSLSGFPVHDGREAMIANTPKEFTDKIIHLLDQPVQRQTMEVAARSFAEQYRWSDTASSYELVFQQAIAKRS